MIFKNQPINIALLVTSCVSDRHIERPLGFKSAACKYYRNMCYKFLFISQHNEHANNSHPLLVQRYSFAG